MKSKSSKKVLKKMSKQLDKSSRLHAGQADKIRNLLNRNQVSELSVETYISAARKRDQRAKLAAKAAALAVQGLMHAKEAGLSGKGLDSVKTAANLAFADAVGQRMQANKNRKRADKAFDAATKRFYSESTSEKVSEGSDKGGLRGWFEGGGWDRYDSKGNKIGKCGGRKPGEAKPKCFSKEKAAALGKKGRAQAVRRKRREDPNPNRSGEPIDTPSTKKGLKMRRKDSSTEVYSDVYTRLAETIIRTLLEKKDACYHKVKATAKVFPSAYASGRIVQCRKKGAANYGKSKK